jgi:hypothetical protein
MTIRNITIHWSAGNDRTKYDEYHYNVSGDLAEVTQTLGTSVKGSHTWMRNTGNIGCAFDAPGPSEVMPVALEAMSKLIAELACKFNLDPKGTITLPAYKRVGVPDSESDKLIPTGGTITAHVVSDHAMFAELDGYPNDRWDVGSRLPASDPRNLYAVIMPKVHYYYDELKAGKCHFEHTVNMK